MLLPSTTLDKAGMQHALLINYSPYPPWLCAFFHGQLPVTFVGRYAPTHIVRGQQKAFGKWTHIQPPSPGHTGAQHIKMLALYYPDRLRLCILTGNMAPVDWLDVENVSAECRSACSRARLLSADSRHAGGVHPRLPSSS